MIWDHLSQHGMVLGVRATAAARHLRMLLQKLNPAISQYRDRRFNGTQADFEDCLKKSTTLYVGNLSFYTTEEQIFEVWL